ncbi:MAG TPA: RNA nucleotidyltransferase [Thermomicrobiales bacterium]|jgi:poly(A) polymerase|nr:RNA nucleotidyltransferase [Thermomicrobiales bacterium]
MDRHVIPNPLQVLDPFAARCVRGLAAAWADAGEELFLVGGVVRDALLGRVAAGHAFDLDFATSTLPEQTQALGREAGASSVYLVGERFGTVGLIFTETASDGLTEAAAPRTLGVEITTYRREAYVDGTRHPVVELGGTLTDDLARRDFTVNAIAAHAATGQLIDPFDGLADLELAVIRAVGDPEERFAEDPLRLLRAARFVAQLGFRIDPSTEDAMIAGAPELARISRERVLAETQRLLIGEYADHGLETLRTTGLIHAALPELIPLAEATVDEFGFGRGRGGVAREKDLWHHTRQVVVQAPTRPVVRWAALLHDAAKPICRSVDTTGEVHFYGHEREGGLLAEALLRRLGADRHTIAHVRQLVELHARPEGYEPDWTDSAVRRLALEAGDVLADLLDLAEADVTSGREHRRRLAADRIRALRDHIARLEAEQELAKLQSPLDGNDLMALFDRPPGRWIAEIKDHLRELVIDGELAPDDREAAERIARDLLAGNG